VHLPPRVRRAIERKIATTVVDAYSCDSGYTPGLASVLLCADGTRHFIKAASVKAQSYAAASYRTEAKRARTLPPGLPAPRLKWTLDEGGEDAWIVLGFEFVEGHNPARPWRPEELAAAESMLVDTARQLTPAPGIGITTFAEEYADWPALWNTVLQEYDDMPGAEQAAELAARFAEVTAGDTLVHFDVRDDNLIVRPDGTVVLCDWSFATRGAAWLDSLTLFIGPRGDGIDVEPLIAAHQLLGSVDPEAIDIVLALIAGYFLYAAAQPKVSNSPWLREVAMWQGEVCWTWLAERRGWIGSDAGAI